MVAKREAPVLNRPPAILVGLHRKMFVLRRRGTIAIAGLLILAAAPVRAQQTNWTGATSSNWFNAGNWTAGVPGLQTQTGIGPTAVTPVIGAPGAAAYNLIIGGAVGNPDGSITAGQPGALTIQNGGSLTNGYMVGNVTSVPTISLWSGTVSVTGAGSNWNLVSPNFDIGATGGTGTVNVLNGGSFSSADDIFMTVRGGTAALVIGTGGTFSVNQLSFVNFFDASVATITIGAQSGNAPVAPGTLNAPGGIDFITPGSVIFNHTSSNYSFAPAISGNASVRVESGTTILTSANTYNNGTSIAGGTLEISGPGASISSDVTIATLAGSTGTFNVTNGGNVTANNGFIGNVAGATGFATVTGAGSSWTTALNFVVGNHGDGTLTVQNGGTFSGNVSVVGFDAGVSGTIMVTGAGSQLSNSATLGIGVNGVGLLTVTNGGTVSDNNAFLGDFGTAKGSAIVSGAGSAWNTTLDLEIGGSGQGALTIANGGTVSVGRTLTIAANTGSTGTLNIGAASGLPAAAAGALVTPSIVFGSGTGSIVFNHTDTGYLFGADVSGAGSVRLESGTTIFTGTSTYGGGTTIAGGILQLGNGGTTGSITGNVSDNTTLAFNRSNTYQFDGVISGQGNVTQAGSGTTILTAANTYSGGTMISAGMLQLGNGSTTGSIIGNITDNGILAFNRSDAVTFSGVVSGSGGVNQVGSGTTTLTGTNTYSGVTTVAAGTLAIAAGGSITSNVTNNANFANAGTVGGNLANTGIASNNLTISGAVANAATFSNNANGTVSGLLTNAAGTTTNAGRLNGGANVSGGTLATTGLIAGGLANTATVNANGGQINGAIANNAGIFDVGGTVTSNSTLTNASGAIVAVETSGNYSLQGLLTNSGFVVNGGTLTATVGGITNNSGGSITVASGGTLKDDLNNAGTVTNAGTYIANVASNSGIINNNATWTGTVSNAGTFNSATGATLSGLLTSTAGIVTNNGALNGGATISGGVLTGTGSVANLAIANGGMFAPGNGTPDTSMAVAGSLAFQSGALYRVQVNPATSSFASVTGTATLGGATVNAVYANGSSVARQYTILTAGSVSGTFGSVVNSNLPPGFKSSLSYDPTHAYLNLAISFVAPPGSGFSGNQQGVADAITGFFNSNGSIPLVFGGLTPAGLTQVSGETAVGSQQTTFDAMTQFLGVMTDPFIAGRGDGATGGADATPFAEEGDGANAYAADARKRSKSERDAYGMFTKAPPAAFEQRWSVWAAGFGGSQTTDGNATLGSNTATSRIAGTAVGADYRFSPFTIAGFALAGGGTNFSVANGGSGRSDLFQAGAFVRHTVGPAYISAALAYGWQDITTDRTVTIAGADQLRAQFNANAYSGRVEGGYRFVTPWMGGFGLTPYAAGQFTTFDLPAYAEQALSGANTFALAYSSQSVTDTRSELGLRTDKSYAVQDGIFTLRGRFAWAHDYNPNRNIAATFQTLPGASFVVNGAAQAPDSALTTASAEMKWTNGWSAAATFEGEFSEVTRSYAGKGVVRYAW
jgi:T5SS/PEP-CTERM-associated repeat protein/autotransporter-associated beta strand protein